MWNFSARIADSDWLFDMFYIERQHQRVRPQAELVKHTATFEPGVLFRVLDVQIGALRRVYPPQGNYCLAGRQLPVTVVATGWLADACVSGGVQLRCDGIVFMGGVGGIAGVILACLLNSDGRLFLKVELMQQVRAGIWTQTVEQALWLARDAIHPAARRAVDIRTFSIFV